MSHLEFDSTIPEIFYDQQSEGHLGHESVFLHYPYHKVMGRMGMVTASPMPLKFSMVIDVMAMISHKFKSLQASPKRLRLTNFWKIQLSALWNRSAYYSNLQTTHQVVKKFFQGTGKIDSPPLMLPLPLIFRDVRPIFDHLENQRSH